MKPLDAALVVGDEAREQCDVVQVAAPVRAVCRAPEDERSQEVGDAYPGRAVLVGQRGPMPRSIAWAPPAISIIDHPLTLADLALPEGRWSATKMSATSVPRVMRWKAVPRKPGPLRANLILPSCFITADMLEVEAITSTGTSTSRSRGTGIPRSSRGPAS